MHALVIDPTGVIAHHDLGLEPGHGLNTLQGLLGGWIDALQLTNDLVVWIRDDHTGLDPNPLTTGVVASLTGQVHLISGVAVFTSTTDQGETAALTPIHVTTLTQLTSAWHAREHVLDRISAATRVKQAWL